MSMVQIDIDMPESCRDCMLWEEHGCNCLAAEAVYGYDFDSCVAPFHKSRRWWTADDHDKVDDLFQDKPKWCPLKEAT